MVELLPALEDLPAAEFARDVDLRVAWDDLVGVVLRLVVLLCLAAGAATLELEEERLERLLDTEGGLGVLLGAVERAGDLDGAGRLTLAGALGAVRAGVLGAVERAGDLDGAGRLTLAGALGALRAEALGADLGAEETRLDDVLACEALPDLLA